MSNKRSKKIQKTVAPHQRDEWNEMLALSFEEIRNVADELMKAALKDEYDQTLIDLDPRSVINDPVFLHHLKMIQQKAAEELTKMYQ